MLWIGCVGHRKLEEESAVDTNGETSVALVLLYLTSTLSAL
jgi:hypothetical protein